MLTLRLIMEIDGAKYYQIGEVASYLGITTRTIRYYEEIGLTESTKRLDGGARVYTKDAIIRFKFILKLKELGISLKEMKGLAEIYNRHKNTNMIFPKLLELLDYHINKIDLKISKLASLREDIVSYRKQIISYAESECEEK